MVRYYAVSRQDTVTGKSHVFSQCFAHSGDAYQFAITMASETLQDGQRILLEDIKKQNVFTAFAVVDFPSLEPAVWYTIYEMSAIM